MESPRPVTVLTGATGGIGQALVHLLEDHQIVLLGRNQRRLTELAASVPQATIRLVDLERLGSLATALTGLGVVDHLVHCAGVAELGTVETTSIETWQRAMTVNVLAAAEITRLLLPQLRAARGTVVFVNSTAGRLASPGWGAYAASKFALRALADSLRGEEAVHGVRVTSIYPGRTATTMQESVRRQEGGDYLASDYAQPRSVAETIKLALTLPSDAMITDLAVRPGPN